MLVIRQAQMKVFEEHAFQNFKDRVFNHLMKVWPEQVSILEHSEIRSSIEKGIERAESYGISSQREVVCYIDLMYINGWDFDCDSTMPWAAEILGNNDLSSGIKIDRLNKMTEKKLGISS